VLALLDLDVGGFTQQLGAAHAQRLGVRGASVAPLIVATSARPRKQLLDPIVELGDAQQLARLVAQ